MKKSIAWFPDQIATNGKPIVKYLLNFLNRDFNVVANSLECDCAIIWSLLWQGKMLGNKAVFDHYQKLNKPVVIVEVGSIWRERTWRVCINSLANYVVNNSGIQIPNQSLATHTNKSKILVCLQNENSGNIVPNDYKRWISNKISLWSSILSDCQVVVRPHPRCKPSFLHNYPIDPNPAFLDSLSTSKLVINYNSSPSILSGIYNIPICCHESSWAFDVSSHEKVQAPKDFQWYDAWTGKIAKSEFDTTQFQSGEVSKLLTNQLQTYLTT